MKSFEENKILVSDPLSAFLGGSDLESRFQISFLDVVHFAGHACPTVTGAFLITKKAIEILFPEDKTCVRGDVKVTVPMGVSEGAQGPQANVISYITGAWSESGFGGLQGKFVRRNLLQYGDKSLRPNQVSFERISSGKKIVLSYHPDRVIDPNETIRQKVEKIMKSWDKVISES